MKALIIIGHPETDSFCYDGIFRTIKTILENKKVEIKTIELYQENFRRENTDLVKTYKDYVSWSTHIYFVSPVWWFRCTPKLEVFFDEVFTPAFAYNFKSITKTMGLPSALLKDKIVRTYITHGAPALPVLTLYANSVKLRLIMGVYSFVFGWNWRLWFRTRQFWSVPFVSRDKRVSYLEKVIKDVKDDLYYAKKKN